MFYEKIRNLSMRAAVLAIAVPAFLFSGCSPLQSPAVFDYAAQDARFTIEFPSRGDAVVCSAEKRGGEFTLRAAEPERSAGLCVICSDDSCTIITQDGDGIVLSPQASARLRDVLSLLVRGSEGGSVSRSDDGELTVITYPDGAVTLGSDLMPISAELFGDGGRTVKIRDYEAVPCSNAENEK